MPAGTTKKEGRMPANFEGSQRCIEGSLQRVNEFQQRAAGRAAGGQRFFSHQHLGGAHAINFAHIHHIGAVNAQKAVRAKLLLNALECLAQHEFFAGCVQNGVIVGRFRVVNVVWQCPS